eukprot:5194936-Alexandrium_andersonii.AAC.1
MARPQGAAQPSLPASADGASGGRRAVQRKGAAVQKRGQPGRLANASWPSAAQGFAQQGAK